MENKPELIVMLTHHDYTVKDAYQVFDDCKDSCVDCWGFKEEGLDHNSMKELVVHMKDCGKTTALEVVAYTERECLAGAAAAVDFGCDILMGTVFFDSVNDFCKENNIRYMPFVGKISGRPSVLEGDIEDMISEAEGYLEKGVYGFDLLSYRYTGDSAKLNEEFVSRIKAPVCIAGSVDSYEKLDEVKNVAPWAFTVGSAFFDNKFDGEVKEQIEKVCEYINQ